VAGAGRPKVLVRCAGERRRRRGGRSAGPATTLDRHPGADLVAHRVPGVASL